MRLPTGSELTALKVADAVFGLKRLTSRPGAAALRRQMEDTKRMGFLLKCKYAVGMALYNTEGGLFRALADVDCPLVLDGQGGEMPTAMSLRATDVRWPLAAMESDSVKVGSHQVNRITGSQSPEIEVTFLETGKSEFVRMLDAIKDFMTPNNGLMRPPAEYALFLHVGLITGVSDIAWRKSFLVGLQNVNLDASARETNTLMEIPVTFSQLDPYMLPLDG